MQLQSQPPVDCARGSEAVLPGSFFEIFFRSRAKDLEAALSRESRLVVDVWHRYILMHLHMHSRFLEKMKIKPEAFLCRDVLKSSVLLGVGSLPLDPFQKDLLAHIEALVPVRAIAAAPGSAAADEQVRLPNHNPRSSALHCLEV